MPEICRIGVELSKKNGMGNLKTEFAGLELRNPIIVSSSNLTDTAECAVDSKTRARPPSC